MNIFKELLLFSHVAFGVMGILAGVWLFVEVLNVSDQNKTRILRASLTVSFLISLSYLIGGYWYVFFYGPDKAIIKSGVWPWAHGFFMETKEHLFFVLLLLSIYLPVAVFKSDLLTNKSSRKLVLTITGLIIIIGLVMEGFGSVISAGVKMGLIGR